MHDSSDVKAVLEDEQGITDVALPGSVRGTDLSMAPSSSANLLLK